MRDWCARCRGPFFGTGVRMEAASRRGRAGLDVDACCRRCCEDSSLRPACRAFPEVL